MSLLSTLARLAGGIAPLTRGMTLGVRGCCIDGDGRVFLVRHTYRPGWYLPGGGIERSETALTALGRELREEGGILLGAEPALFGVYYNRLQKRDHVIVYVSRDFSRPNPPPIPNREIAEAGFFKTDALPDEATPATRRRIGEIFAGAAIDPFW